MRALIADVCAVSGSGCAEFEHYGKFHVIRLDLERQELEFSRQYQADGTRTFK